MVVYDKIDASMPNCANSSCLKSINFITRKIKQIRSPQNAFFFKKRFLPRNNILNVSPITSFVGKMTPKIKKLKLFM